jgi:hypothetical protein
MQKKELQAIKDPAPLLAGSVDRETTTFPVLPVVQRFGRL